MSACRAAMSARSSRRGSSRCVYKGFRAARRGEWSRGGLRCDGVGVAPGRVGSGSSAAVRVTLSVAAWALLAIVNGAVGSALRMRSQLAR